jgi:hypothetical protein
MIAEDLHSERACLDGHGHSFAWQLPARERPVFVAADKRRAYALRAIGCAAGTLMALWLVALVAGALDTGGLPVVPAQGALEHAGPREKARHSGEVPSVGRLAEAAAAVRSGRLAEAAAAVRSAATGLEDAGHPATETHSPYAAFAHLGRRAPGRDPRIGHDHGARVRGETWLVTSRGGGAAQPTTPPTPQADNPTEPGTNAPAPSASPDGSRRLYEPPVGGPSEDAPRANGLGDPSDVTFRAARRPTEG